VRGVAPPAAFAVKETDCPASGDESVGVMVVTVGAALTVMEVLVVACAALASVTVTVTV
jgi:hypothetical protein